MISLSSTILNFGSLSKGEIVSKQVTIYNTAATAVSITNIVSSSTDYEIVPLSFSIDAYSSKNITIRYTANNQLTATGTISISNTAGPAEIINVSANVKEPVVIIDTSVMDFGRLSVSDTAVLTRTISNTATNDSILTVNILSADPNFIIKQSTIKVLAGQSANIEIQFAPTTSGAKSEQINLLTNDSIGLYTFNTSGNGIVPSYTLSTSSLNFGSIPINTTASVTFDITNNENDINFIVNSVTIYDDKVSLDISSIKILPLQTQTFTATFLPTSSAVISGFIRLSSNAGLITVIYYGIGLVVPAVKIQPTVISLGIYSLNIDQTEIITIQNIGVVDLTISSVTFPTVAGTTFIPSVTFPQIVNHGDTLTFTITIHSVSEVSFVDVITINSDAFNNPHTIVISGVARSPLISIDVTILDFGTIQIGSQKVLSFTVQNTADVQLSVAIADINAFTVSENSFVVPGHDSHIVSVAFSIDAPGSVDELLTINSNDIFNPTVLVNLLGSADANHSFTVIPEKITNNFISKGIASTTQLIIINSSSLSSSINSYSVTDLLGVASYSITADNLPITLMPGEAVTINVTILATSVGIVASDLKFSTTVGDVATSLVIRYEGEVFAPTIQLSSSSLNFGSVAIGETDFQDIVITNTSREADLLVNLSSTNDVFHFKTPIQENLTVAYSNSKYTVNTSNQALILDSVTVIDNVTGDQYVLGDPSNPNQFSVNTDTGAITVNSAASGKSLRVNYDQRLPTSSITILANNHSTVSIGFSPRQLGYQSGSITAQSNDEVNPTLLINASGTGVANVASIAQDSVLVEFVAKVDATVAQKVVLKNTGTVKLHVISITVVAPFSVTTSQFSIDPNETYDLEIMFSPTNNVLVNQNIVIHSNAPDLSIAVVGQGDYPHISLPSSFDFGHAPVNIQTDKTFTIGNTGTVDLAVDLQLNSAYFVISPTVFSVLPNSSYDVTVSFKPTVAQVYTESIKILSDDESQSEINYAITGTGVDKPVIQTVSRLQFDNTNVREVSQKILEVFNKGSETLSITSISVTENPATFSLVSASAVNIAPGASTQFTVRFSPQNAPSDFITGKISIINNDSDSPNVEVLLKGKGIQPDGEWQSFNLNQMIPSALVSAANDVNNVIDPLKTILTLIQSIFSIIKVLLVDEQSALKAILQQIFNVIKMYVDDLLSSGVYMLPIFPSTSYYDPGNNTSDFAKFLASIGGGSANFKQRVVNSFDDIYDNQRPQFSNTGTCGAFVIAIDSGNISEIVKGIIALKKIFTSIEWQPNVQEPQALQALSGTAITLRWELPEFLTFNVAGIFNKQKFVDLIDSFEVYRSENQSRLVTATQDHYDENNQIISKIGDVIDIVTNKTVTSNGSADKMVGTVSAKEYQFRTENFAVGWKNANNEDTAKAMGYEFKDSSVESGKNYYYTVRSKLGDIYSKLSNEVVGTKIQTQVVSSSSESFLNRCVNFRCIKTKATTKTTRSLPQLTVKLINRTGIVIQSQSRYNANNVVPDANQQQVNTFVQTITSVHVDISTLVVRNPSEAARRISVNNLSIDSTIFFDNGTIKNWDDAGSYQNNSSLDDQRVQLNKNEYFGILNDTRLVPGWDLLVTYQGNDTILTLSDISNAGYKQGDYIVVEYYTSDYTAQCAKQKTQFDAVKCNDGTNQANCTDYHNARCLYHGGTVCLNKGNTKLDNRCIPNATFFDQYRCQDATVGGEVRALDLMKRNDPNFCIETTGVCAGYQALSEQSIGMYPNWTSLAAMKSFIKPVEGFIDTLEAWVNKEIDAIQKGSDSTTQFIDLLSKKITALQSLIDTIQKILNTFLAIFGSEAGFYILTIDPAVGGTQRVKQMIQSAEGGPDSGSDGYTAGIVLLIGSANASEIQATYQFLKLFFK
jgi:hypothetical protein